VNAASQLKVIPSDLRPRPQNLDRHSSSRKGRNEGARSFRQTLRSVWKGAELTELIKTLFSMILDKGMSIYPGLGGGGGGLKG
jgi:hypothetical protein